MPWVESWQDKTKKVTKLVGGALPGEDIAQLVRLAMVYEPSTTVADLAQEILAAREQAKGAH